MRLRMAGEQDSRVQLLAVHRSVTAAFWASAAGAMKWPCWAVLPKARPTLPSSTHST